MRTCRRLRQLLREGSRVVRRATQALLSAGRALAARLAYRPREVVVVALLAGGLFAGLAVERWRARHPATAERLEAEPPRLTSAAAAPPVSRSRPRPGAPRCDPSPAGRRTVDSGSSRSGSPRLDLNRATPRQLARLAGISWSLAARIVAARDAFEGRDAGAVREQPGVGRDVRYRRRGPTRADDGAQAETDTPTSPASAESPLVPASPEPTPGEDTLDPTPQ
jgi:DNA uptake protein ComE-like DNA-binding protein